MIAPTGILHASLRVTNLMVEGRLHGNVVASDKITLTSGARLEGDITARQLEVREGAGLRGFCRIDPHLELIPNASNHNSK